MFPDGTHFYPDKQGDDYGFNTDAARGADTFRPFSGNFKVTVITQTSAYNQVSGVNFYIYQTIELQIKRGAIISQKVTTSQSSNQAFSHGKHAEGAGKAGKTSRSP